MIFRIGPYTSRLLRRSSSQRVRRRLMTRKIRHCELKQGLAGKREAILRCKRLYDFDVVIVPFTGRLLRRSSSQ